jgi:hypothetical protein
MTESGLASEIELALLQWKARVDPMFAQTELIQ